MGGRERERKCVCVRENECVWEREREGKRERKKRQIIDIKIMRKKVSP